LAEERKVLIGGIMLPLTNIRVLSNLIISGVLEKFPELKIVSVESGIGWIPFLLESLDYNFEDAPEPFLALKPSEYFRRQVYSCFWFEKVTQTKLEEIGVMNVLF